MSHERRLDAPNGLILLLSQMNIISSMCLYPGRVPQNSTVTHMAPWAAEGSHRVQQPMEKSALRGRSPSGRSPGGLVGDRVPGGQAEVGASTVRAPQS